MENYNLAKFIDCVQSMIWFTIVIDIDVLFRVGRPRQLEDHLFEVSSAPLPPGRWSRVWCLAGAALGIIIRVPVWVHGPLQVLIEVEIYQFGFLSLELHMSMEGEKMNKWK